MTLLYFVTPAFQRFDLTAICLDQRLDVIRTLAGHGIEGRCVVIADDANLELARERGFDTIEQDNDWLGRRFNDGIEHAVWKGAEWIVPIGSDSWVEADYFLPLPHHSLTRTSHMYAPVLPDRLAELRVGKLGAGPHTYHRSLLRASRFRPLEDRINKNCDSSLIKGIGRAIRWEWRDTHPLQYVGFRVAPFITHYERLWTAWGVNERTDPFGALAMHYPSDLVDRVRVLMTEPVPAGG